LLMVRMTSKCLHSSPMLRLSVANHDPQLVTSDHLQVPINSKQLMNCHDCQTDFQQSIRCLLPVRAVWSKSVVNRLTSESAKNAKSIDVLQTLSCTSAFGQTLD
jgi:hypothetical protein